MVDGRSYCGKESIVSALETNGYSIQQQNLEKERKEKSVGDVCLIGLHCFSLERRGLTSPEYS